MLQERAAARGVTLPPQVAPEPKELGQVLTDLHGKPGQLRDILGGGDAQPQEQAQRSNPIIDMLGSPQAKAVLAGIAAMVVKRVMQVVPNRVAHAEGPRGVHRAPMAARICRRSRPLRLGLCQAKVAPILRFEPKKETYAAHKAMISQKSKRAA